MHLERQPHDDRQHDEKENTSYEQRQILQREQQIHHPVKENHHSTPYHRVDFIAVVANPTTATHEMMYAHPKPISSESESKNV